MTLPVSISDLATAVVMLIGMANPIPILPPPRLKMALLMPTTSPRRLMSGPPLFPGLIEASVWMKSS